MNKGMKETLESLNVKHITTSLYHPQNNAKVEQFHRFLEDVSEVIKGERMKICIYS